MDPRSVWVNFGVTFLMKGGLSIIGDDKDGDDDEWKWKIINRIELGKNTIISMCVYYEFVIMASGWYDNDGDSLIITGMT